MVGQDCIHGGDRYKKHMTADYKVANCNVVVQFTMQYLPDDLSVDMVASVLGEVVS